MGSPLEGCSRVKQPNAKGSVWCDTCYYSDLTPNSQGYRRYCARCCLTRPTHHVLDPRPKTTVTVKQITHLPEN